jgi:hypothetical protein
MLKIINWFLITLAVIGFLNYAGGWGGLVLIIAVIVVVVGSLFTDLLRDPNEREAKRQGLDSWTPHNSSVYTAEMAVYDLERGFGGSMDCVGCHIDVNASDRYIWFGNKREALCFFRDHLYYLTQEYEETPYEDKLDEKTLAKFDKLIEGDEPSVTVLSNFLTKLFPESFKYIGTLSHICTAKKGMSYLRSEFRNANGRGDSNGPLSKSDIDGFIEFLANYEDSPYSN